MICRVTAKYEEEYKAGHNLWRSSTPSKALRAAAMVALSLEMIEETRKVGCGLNASSKKIERRIPVISESAAERILEKFRPTARYSVGTAKGAPINGVIRKGDKIKEHDKHGCYKTVAIIR